MASAHVRSEAHVRSDVATKLVYFSITAVVLVFVATLLLTRLHA